MPFVSPKKLTASVFMVSVPSDDPAQTKQFFENLLGINFVRTLEEEAESYHAPISADGIDLQIGPKRHPQETPTIFFHVDDIDSALQNIGGHVVFGPSTLVMSDQALRIYSDAYARVEAGPASRGVGPQNEMGQVAMVQAPGGSVIGLMQLADHLHAHFKVGANQVPLDEKQEQRHQAAEMNARRMFGSSS